MKNAMWIIMLASAWLHAGAATGQCPDGLIHYWKFNEMAGTNAVDEVGEANGFIYGGTIWTNGQLGGGLHFRGEDANSDYMRIPGNPLNDLPQGSFAVRVRAQSQTTWHMVYSKTVFGTADYFNLLLSPGATQVQARINNVYLAAGLQQCGIDRWLFLVVTWDGARHKIYEDGNLILDEASTATIPNANVVNYVGVQNSGDSPQFGYARLKGTIDEMAVYNRALTAEEIARQYAAGMAAHGYCATNEVPPSMIARPITISHAGAAWTNAAILVRLNTLAPIAEGKMRADGGDIRFYDADGSTPLAYWLESGLNTTSTLAWVRIPLLTNGGTTASVRYGDPDLESASSLAQVFPTLSRSAKRLWVKANDGPNDPTPGNGISTWADLSGTGRTLMPHMGGATFSNNVFNGLPAAYFDGSDSYAFTRISDIRSAFWVLNETAAGAGDGSYLLGDDAAYSFARGGAAIWHSTYAAAAIQNGSTRLNGVQVNGAATALPQNAPSLLSLVTTGDVQANRFDKDRTYHGPFIGFLAEILIYNEALGSAEVEEVERYLNQKYRIYDAAFLPSAEVGEERLNPAISGRVVAQETGAGIDGLEVVFSDGGGSILTAGGGFYAHPVPFGWSGTVAVAGDGGIWTILPQERGYTNLATDLANQDFILYPGDWAYRRSIVVDNPGAVDLQDFQVSVELDTATPIAAGRMRADGGDIRFYAAVGGAALSHWVEPGTLNRTNTRVWFRTPMIPAGSATTNVLYYGCPSATYDGSAGGAATFELFDDFDDGILSPAWAFVNNGNAGNTYSETAAPGKMTLTTAASDLWGSSFNAGILQAVQPVADWEAIVDVTLNGDANYQVFGLVAYTNADNWVAVGKGYHSSYGNENVHWKREIAGANDQNGIAHPGDSVQFMLRKTGSSHTAGWSDDGAVRNGLGTAAVLNSDKIGLLAQKTTSGAKSAVYDNFRVRKIAAAELTATVGAEQNLGMAISGRITLAATGGGVEGAMLDFSGLAPVWTEEDGTYARTVPAGWSGSVVPSYPSGTFDPEMRTYESVNAGHTGQDFVLQGVAGPGVFSLESPISGGQVMGVATLKWSVASGAAAYDVYLGQDEPLSLLATVATNEFVWAVDRSGPLQWHVVARNVAGERRAPEATNATFVAYPMVILTGSVAISATNISYENAAVVQDGGTLTLDGTHTFASLSLINGATVTHSAATTTWESKIDLTVLHALSISSNSAINVVGKGYLAGRTWPNTTNNAVVGQSGGSYGGMGASSAGTPNPVYGDFRDPNELGSGGWFGPSPGGGLIRIAAEVLDLQGQINASGLSGENSRGSGGGIRLEVGELLGTGQILANGGNGTAGGYALLGGGGGRVAVYYGDATGFNLTNQINASGGTGAHGAGGAGTVYLQRQGEAGTLVVDAKSGGNRTTPLWLPVAATNYGGNLIIRRTTAELQSGDLLQFGDIVADAGGKFIARGTNSWASLSVTAAGQAILSGTNEVQAPLILNGGTAEVNGRLTAPGAILTNAAVLTHSAATATNECRLDLQVNGKLYVSTNSAISAVGKGYLAGRTFPNTTNGASTGYSGGSYGGLGGVSSGARVNPVYGDFRNPNEPGSGGAQGPGGGLVRIAADEMELYGQIDASAEEGYQGRGSGGGVLLDVGRLTGSGLILSKGKGENGGGGGRIAIVYDQLDGFNPANQVSAAGKSTSFAVGGPGSVYLEHRGEPGTLFIDRKGEGAKTTPVELPAGADPFAGQITVNGAGTVADLQPGMAFQDGDIAVSAGGRIILNGAYTWDDMVVTNTGQAVIYGTNSFVRLAVGNGGGLQIFSATTQVAQAVWINGGTAEVNGVLSAPDVVLTNAGVLTHTAATATNEYRLELVVSNTLSISTNSAINASGKGYLPRWTYPNTTTNASAYYSGGSYGGRGGARDPTYFVNPVYGDFRNPNELGSGGGNASGGGLVRVAAGVLDLQGQINVDGWGASIGGGSGGGIHVDAGVLRGGGQIWARGGAGTTYGSGGGGRIAVCYGELDGFDLTNRVIASGAPNSNPGGPGTVYLKRQGETGVLLVDCKTGGTQSTPLWLPTDATNYTGDLVVRGMGTVAELQSADLIQPASVVASAGGRFIASGDLIWSSLAIRDAGQMRLDGTHQVLAPLVVNRGTAEVNGVLSAPDVVLTNAGVLTHTAATATNECRLELVVSNTLSISSNSAINANAKGYLPGRTYPNTTTNASTGYSGGSYGGLGNGDSGVVNPVYGDFRNPNELGSGSPQAPGGGLVRLQAAELALDGQITANSLSSGSGGGIYLDVGRLAGGGLVSASGWTQGCCGRDGGGGRVAIYYDIVEGFDLTNRVSATATGAGGPGTVYLQRGEEPGVLMIDRKTGGVKTTPVWLPAGATNYHGDLLVRGTGTVVELQSSDLIQPANITASAGGRFVASGTFTWANLYLENAGQMRLDGTHQVLAPMVINRGTAEVNGVLSAPDVVLTNAGTLSHSAPTATNEYRLELVVSNTLSISSNSAINVNAKGYLPGRTYPNTTTNASTGYSGGSYGGLGNGDSGVVNPVYGDFRNPNELGSSSPQAPGGGLARIQAAELALDGQITANSLSSGSGGGIYLDVGRLAGGGLVSASGWTQGCCGRDGGGGRVAIYYDTLAGFDLTNRVSATATGSGGPGTVYLQRGEEAGVLMVDRKTGGVKTTPIWLPAGATNFTGDLVVQGTGTVAELQSADLIQPANVLASAGGRFFASGELIWGGLTIMDAGQVRLDGTNQVRAPLVINRGTAEVNGVLSVPDVVLTNAGMLTHSAATGTTEYRLELMVSNTLSISSNSAINVNGKGYAAGRTYPNTTTNASTGYSGGSYGGLGGANSGVVNPVYGDASNPNEPGSGGSAGAGGGLVRIATPTLDLQGQIAASGTDSTGGRGSGGGIRLDVDRLTGGGQLAAKGGNSGNGNGGGGGGRVAIYYKDMIGFSVTGNVNVAGGSGSPAGSAGTIFATNIARVQLSMFAPTGHVGDVVSHLTLTFATPLDDASLGLDDMSLTGPSGVVDLLNLVKMNAYSYQVDLASPATEDGQYTFTLGTNIVTIGGNPPDGPSIQSFILDFVPPALPEVTNYSAVPATNWVRSTSVTLQGIREDYAAIWIDGVARIVSGTGGWSYVRSLNQGLNSCSYYAVDRAGNVSETGQLLFLADTIAPAVTVVSPLNNAYTAAPPALVRLAYVEATSGLDIEHSACSLKRAGIAIAGDWEAAANLLEFIPASPLADGAYNVSATLVDHMGNTGTFSSVFTVDTVAPTVPVVHPVTTPTTINQQTIAGTREPNAAVYCNGSQVVALSGSTAWSWLANFQSGDNNYSFSARDAAGNESGATNVTIFYNDVAPGPVAVTAQVYGVGTQITLGWSGYDELANGGDIATYHVYQGDSSFSHVSQATQIGTRTAGQKNFVVTGLVRNQAKYFAVVARDTGGLCNSNVTCIAAAPIDNVPPANPANLRFECGWSNLTARWSAVGDADLAGYRFIFTNESPGEALATSVLEVFQTNLVRASAYAVRVKAFDNDGNESTGTAGTGHTLLENPTNILAAPYSGLVDLQWSASSPTQFVKRYDVYVSTNPFSDTVGLTARVSSTTRSASVTALEDNRAYYFGVAAVNLSDGADTNVVTAEATPRPDTQGPALSNLRFETNAVDDGLVIRRPGTFRLNAWDRGGMSRVEFRMDGVLLGTDANGSTNYSMFWNVALTTNDGPHELEIRAYDTRANETLLQTNVEVELAVPLEPAITQPANGGLVNKPQNWVAGTGALYSSSAVIYVNGVAATGTPLAVSGAGAFGGWIQLPEGTNSLRAAAVNRAGEGAQSAPVSVVVDLTIPSAPIQLTATAKAGGVVQLSWVPVLGAKGYWIYRSTAPFTETSTVARLNASLWSGTYCQDVTPADGTYYYRVATVNQADTESPLSPQAQVATDRTAPYVVSVGYSTTGVYSPTGPRYGRGKVTVSVLLNEVLQAAPFFSLNPAGGTPIALALKRNATNSLLYAGSFDVGDHTPCGTAYAVFSGWDLAGNRGVDIQGGGTVILDSCGPAMTGLQVVPAEPIQNDAEVPATVTVVAAFDAGDLPVGGPGLQWRLSQTQAEWMEMALSPLSGSTWGGSLMLPAAAGETGESLEFAYQGVDDLGNTGTVIAAQSSFQIYQGGLPPLETPWGLSGVALPGGQVKLTWQGVDEASGYVVLRGPASDDLSVWATNAGVVEYQETVGNATNWYAVASLRSANGQVSTSAWSSAVRVVADDQAPAAPTGMQLALAGNGMYLTWTPPAETNVRYNVYRDATCLESLAGKTPVVTNAPIAVALDRNPLKGTAYYVVSAVDSTGNESGPSACAYTNLSLLPVNSLKVRLVGAGWPLVTWTHPARNEIDGFNLYLDGGSPVLLGSFGPLAENYEDRGYSGFGVRQYRIAAKDANGGNDVESISRSVLLPALQATLSPASTLKKGVMNRLDYQVANLAGQTVENVQLKVQAAGRLHLSEPFAVAAGGTADVSVVVGGYTNLAAVEVMTNALMAQTLEGEVEIVSTASLATGEDKLVAEIANDELLRGVPGKVRFTLHNTSPEGIEIVTAVNAGDSPEVRVKLETVEGMVLAASPLRQSVGAQVVTIAGGASVARIPAGESFASGDILLTVPTNAPQSVRLKLEIDKIHYHHGDTDHVEMGGLTTTRAVELFETIYWAAVTNVTPAFSLITTNILIQGQTVNRATGNAQMNVPAKLTVSLEGFERTYTVTSDTAGAWAQWFEPLPNESGLYKTWAVHPSIVAKPEQAQFVISSVWVTPAGINLTTRRNVPQVLPSYVTVSKGMALTNLHLVYLQEDQPGGVFAPHVTVTVTQNVAVAAGGQKTALNFTVLAGSEATNTATLVLRMVSDGCPVDGWGKITVNATIVEEPPQVPALNWSPGYVYTGVAASNQVHTGLKLWNSGNTNLLDVELAVKTTNGAAAPAWVILNTSPSLGTLAPGQERQVSLTFSPTGGVAEALHEFRLHIAAANHPDRQVALYAQVDNSGRGSALFKVTDIYTGTTNQQGGLIQGLQGARIWLQRESGTAYETNRTTDVLGEAMIEGLPEGSYIYKVTAANHEASSGRIWVRPGVTTPTDVALKNVLVTVEWSVQEITLEDRYELVLTTVYQTDVPAAVVIIDPLNVILPTNMAAGDVFNGEIRLVNQGLIRAEHVRFQMPADDANYKFEIMRDVPQTIEAKQAVRIPFRVLCLTTPEAEDEGGGATCPKSYKGKVGYDFCCINGTRYTNSVDTYFTVPTSCPASATGTAQSPGSAPGAEVWNVIGGDGGGAVSSGGGDVITAPTKPSSGAITPVGKPCVKDNCDENKDPCCRFLGSETSKSIVRMTVGEYADERLDLLAMAIGGRVGMERKYESGIWKFVEPLSGFTYAVVDPPPPEQEIPSESSPEQTPRRPQAPSRLMEPPPVVPRSITITNQGIRTQYTYDTSGLLTGVWDHFTNQVLWIEYADSPHGTPRVTRVLDRAGRSVIYQYDNLGLLIQVVDVMGFTERYTYDRLSRMTSKTLPGQTEFSLEYNTYGQITRAGDKRFEYHYDPMTLQYYAAVKTADGNMRETWMDEAGNLLQQSLNGVIVYDHTEEDTPAYPALTYNEQGLITRVEYEDGTYEMAEYNGPNFAITRLVDERGNVTLWQYDEDGRVSVQTTLAGTDGERQIQLSYDDLGQVVSKTIKGKGEVPDIIWHFTYDQMGNVTTETDPWGNVVSNRYDLAGNCIGIDRPGRGTWQFLYDPKGALVSTTDPLGQTTSNRYDMIGRLVWTRDVMGREYGQGYTEEGKLAAVTNEWGQVMRYEYNEDGTWAQTIGFDGQLTYPGDGYASVDTNSEVVVERDENGLITALIWTNGSIRYAFDSNWNMTEKVEQEGATSRTNRWTYNAHGDLLQFEDALGRKWGYEYNNAGAKTRLVDPLSNAIEVAYAPTRKLGGYVDARGNVIEYQYDLMNREEKEIRADGSVWIRRRNERGESIETEDSSGRIKAVTYDPMGRDVILTCRITNGTLPDIVFSITSDAYGRTVGYSGGGATGAIEYIDSNRIVRTTVDYGPFAKTHERHYDEQGRMIRLVMPGGQTISYAYGADNQLARMEIPDEGIVEMRSDAFSNEIVYPGNLRQHWLFNDFGRATANRVLDAGGNTVWESSYSYYPDGRLEETKCGGGIQAYQYDASGRLTGMTDTRYPSAAESYSYDAAGNRLTAGDTNIEWVVVAGNRLMSWPGGSYVYDSAGRVVQRIFNGDIQNYTYDAAGFMSKVEGGEGTLIARYLYDIYGQRVAKITPAATNWYLYGPDGIIGEYDSTGHPIREYIWRPDSTYMAGMVAMLQGGVWNYAVLGIHGMPMMLAQSSGEVTWECIPMGFGDVLVRAGATATNHLRRSGQYYDEETGLYYNTMRYYDPATGRYLTPDPLGYVDGLNYYIPCWNDPINHVDPYGLAGYFFDGTGNSANPTAKGDAVSHIYLLYKAYRGANSTYVPGIGSGYHADGRPYSKEYDDQSGTMVSRSTHEMATGLTMDDRIDYMLKQVRANVIRGDRYVDVFGFSRGGASALEFLNRLQDEINEHPEFAPCIKIRFVGLFDVVSSMRKSDHAGPDFLGYNEPVSEYTDQDGVKKPWRFHLPENMQYYMGVMPAHFIMMDELRKDFMYTDLGDAATQVQYKGRHAEGGGGYQENAFGWHTLNDMADRAIAANVPIDKSGFGSLLKGPFTPQNPDLRPRYDAEPIDNGYIKYGLEYQLMDVPRPMPANSSPAKSVSLYTTPLGGKVQPERLRERQRIMRERMMEMHRVPMVDMRGNYY